MNVLLTRLGLAGSAALAATLGLVTPTQAAPPSALIYVSPTATPAGDNSSCAQASETSLQTAVDSVSPGGTVVACAGTYPGFLNITTAQITLRGEGAAIIDANGAGVGVGIGADYVTVKGLTVENAKADAQTQLPGDGIVTAGLVNNVPTPGNFATITGNHTVNNEGAGIDLESTHNSTAGDNVSRHNGIGINVADDLPDANGKPLPAFDNVISGNTTNDNPGGCGIVLADHTGAGVYSNKVIGNVAARNGLGTPTAPNASSGSGIIFGGAVPNAIIKNNLVENNVFYKNGHGGVAIHGHAPGADFSGNRIVHNVFGKNNLRDDYKDTKSTGIYLGTVGTITMRIAHNLIENDTIGIFTAGDVTLKGVSTNTFRDVRHHVVHIKKYAG